jgi:hypothetical protein
MKNISKVFGGSLSWRYYGNTIIPDPHKASTRCGHRKRQGHADPALLFDNSIDD